MIGGVSQPSTHLVIDADGTLKAGAVDVSEVIADNIITSGKLQNNAVVAAKLGTDVPLSGGVWDPLNALYNPGMSWDGRTRWIYTHNMSIVNSDANNPFGNTGRTLRINNLISSTIKCLFLDEAGLQPGDTVTVSVMVRGTNPDTWRLSLQAVNALVGGTQINLATGVTTTMTGSVQTLSTTITIGAGAKRLDIIFSSVSATHSLDCYAQWLAPGASARALLAPVPSMPPGQQNIMFDPLNRMCAVGANMNGRARWTNSGNMSIITNDAANPYGVTAYTLRIGTASTYGGKVIFCDENAIAAGDNLQFLALIAGPVGGTVRMTLYCMSALVGGTVIDSPMADFTTDGTPQLVANTVVLSAGVKRIDVRFLRQAGEGNIDVYALWGGKTPQPLSPPGEDYALINELLAARGTMPGIDERLSVIMNDDGTLKSGVVTDVTNAMLATDIKVGSLSSLTTVLKSSVVGAINELHEEHGNLGSLGTTAKGTFVESINELEERIDALVLASGNSDIEVADARGTEAILGDRLRKTDANIFNVLHYGAVGDAGDVTPTDDTLAIRAAIAAATAAAAPALPRTAPIVYFPPGYAFFVTDQIDFGTAVSVVMESPIVYDATAAAQVAVHVGSQTTATHTTFKHFKLWVEGSAYADWTADVDEERIGIRLSNLYACKVEIVLAFQFTIGVQCYGNVGGFSLNTILTGRIVDCKVGLDLRSATSAGWVNENLFLGGTFGHNGGSLNYATNKANEIIGIRIGSDLSVADIADGTKLRYANNKNTFVKPCFELGYTVVDAGGGSVRCVVINAGGANTFYDCRVENCTPTFGVSYFGRVSGPTTYMNRAEYTFSGGYGVGGLGAFGEGGNLIWEDTTGRNSMVGYASNVAIHGVRSRLLPSASLIFDSGPVYKSACPYNGAGSPTYHVPRLSLQTNSTTPTIAAAQAGLTIAANYLLLPSTVGLGLYVDTSEAKRFGIICQLDEASDPGEFNVLCYAANGSVLYNNTAGAYNTQGQYYVEAETYGAPFTARTAYGNSYYITYVRRGVIFQVHSDVKYIFISLCDCSLKSFQLYALPTVQLLRPPTVWSGYDEIVPGCNIGTAPPTTGVWARGRRIYNAAPSGGGVEGWICVDASTPPGTWRAFGSIAAS